MIKRILPFALIGIATVAVSSCGNKSTFKKTASGMEYRIVKDAPGDKKPAVGDQVEMNITIRLTGKDGKDTVLFSSQKMNNNQPVAFPLESPKYGGDVNEGFAMLTPGDSAIFRVSVDTLRKINGGQLPPYMSAGSTLNYEVMMVSVKTKDEVIKENETKSAQQREIDDKLLQEYLAKNNINAQKTPSGLYYTINTPGSGENAKSGQTVSVNYTGKTMDGKTFDSNVDPAFQHVEPFKMVLGQGQVIRGWDEGLALLNKGSKATLYIPSTLAYGAQGNPSIPANSILIFDVQILDIQ